MTDTRRPDAGSLAVPPARRRGDSLTPIALTVAALIVLVGCSGSEVAVDAGIRDQDAWKMPLDEFYVYSVELDNYAEQLLISNCVEEIGYEWPVPWQDTEYPQPEDFNAIGFRLFTVELAKEYGYQLAPPANDESARLWMEFGETVDSYFPNVELDEALLACTDEVRTVDTDSNQNFDGVNYLASLAMQADEVARQDPAVIEATARWRECLQPQVDFTLPEDPRTGMPPHGARDQWGSEEGKPSAEEIGAAVADAECRESSGLSAAAYEKNWDAQVTLVEENRDTLERIRSEAIDRKADLLTIVAENSPTAP